MRDWTVAEWEELEAIQEILQPGQFGYYEDGSEYGVCKKCRLSYIKTAAQSCVSLSGYCFRCGYNP